jgi:hypothetical protein
MITEILQELLELLRRIFCWHKFKIVIRRDNGADYYIREKCDYIKKLN